MSESKVYDDDLQLMLCCALRYALGRHTYIVLVTATFLRDKLKYLSQKTLAIMQEDLVRYFDDTVPLGYEFDCDIASWKALHEAIGEEIVKKGGNYELM